MGGCGDTVPLDESTWHQGLLEDRGHNKNRARGQRAGEWSPKSRKNLEELRDYGSSEGEAGEGRKGGKE